MFWTFLAALAIFAAFMLALALSVLLGRQKARKPECSCKKAARIMATKAIPQHDSPGRVDSDSIFPILGDPAGGCRYSEKQRRR